jgi:hypothetical protein
MAVPPPAYACVLARDRFWQDEQRRLIGTHPDWPDAAYFLDLDEELAHAFVLVLSRLPTERRRDFAEAFYAGRSGRRADRWSDWPPALAAAVVLEVVDLLEPELRSERVLDLLHGAAQGDDLSRTPEPAVRELRKTIARIRFDVEPVDSPYPRRSVALALAEVLDPAGDRVDLKEVLARSAWAAVETWEPERVLGLLLRVERRLADA